jgi:hypothetical protein
MSSMRRVLLPLLLLLALVAVPAAHAATGADKVIADCTDDEVIQGTYTQKQLANALAKLGSDAAEYTDCARVIHNAQLALASKGKASSSGGATTGGGSGTGTSSSTGNGTATTPQTTTSPATSGNAPGAFGGFSGYPSNPGAASKEQRAAISEAQDSPVAEQKTELASTTLPGPVIAALAAGGIGLLVLLLLDLRRRVVARRG